MKQYYTIALCAIIASYAAHLQSYSINFKNDTDKDLYISGKVEFTKSESYSEYHYNYSTGKEERQYKTRDRLEKDNFKIKLPSQKRYSWKYAKTLDIQYVVDISFEIIDDADPYAIPSLVCNSKNHRSIYNKILGRDHWFKSMPENCLIIITKKEDGTISAEYKSEK